MTEVLPMFPLGSVLMPHAVLPLHIFEIRYQQLLNHALESDRRFGVVLIRRGSEVGGGDVRNDIGTVAHIEEYQRFDDGRAAVASIGKERFEVVEWLDDDPFPRARVRALPSEPVVTGDRERLRLAQDAFERLIEVARRQNRLANDPLVEWSDDCDEASWQLASRAPLSPHDAYRVLAAETRAQRLDRLATLLDELSADLELMGEF